MLAPRILVTRRLPGDAVALLARRCRVDLNRADRPLTHAQLRRRIRVADGLLCLPSDPIDAAVIREGVRLKGIANCAVGVNNINLRAAKRRGIPVTNTPGVLTAATADLTWALLLAVARRVVEGDRLVRRGRFRGWGPSLLLGSSLEGKVLGVIGMGRIGQAVARRGRSFGMRVVYHTRTRLATQVRRSLRARPLSLDRLLAQADVVTLHLPLNPGTRRFIGAAELSRMKREAILINTARGEIVDEAALIRFLQAGRIAGAGLDVYAREPQVPTALKRLHQVVLLPHIGSATRETREGMAMLAAKNLLAILAGKEPPNRVI